MATTALPRHPAGDAAMDDGTLSLRFLGLGLVALIGCLWALPWGAGAISDGRVLTPYVLGLIHLAALGWLTMVAIGASYQLVPVALGAALWSPALAAASFWIYGAGVATLVAGFFSFASPLLMAGAVAVGAALTLFLLNLALTLRRVPRWTLTGAYMSGAYVLLGAAASLGISLVADLQLGFSAHLLATGPAAHAFLAVFGWLVPLIVGVSYKLLPMFGLIHGHSQKLGKWSLPLALGAPLGAALSLLAGSPHWSAFVLAEALLLSLVCLDIHRMMRRRLRKAADDGLRFVVTGLYPLTLATWAGVWAAFGGPLPLATESFWAALGVLVFLGGLSPIVLGYLHKILPFLQWLRRYAPLAGQGNVPKTSDLIDARASRIGFVTYQGALATVAVALLAGHGTCLTVAFGLLALSGTWVATHLLAILRK